VPFRLSPTTPDEAESTESLALTPAGSTCDMVIKLQTKLQQGNEGGQNSTFFEERERENKQGTSVNRKTQHAIAQMNGDHQRPRGEERQRTRSSNDAVGTASLSTVMFAV
jgi:hypothetical protein